MSCNSFFLMRKSCIESTCWSLKPWGWFPDVAKKKLSTNDWCFCTPTHCLHPFSAASTEESIVPIFMRNRDAYGLPPPRQVVFRCDKKVTLLKVPAVSRNFHVESHVASAVSFFVEKVYKFSRSWCWGSRGDLLEWFFCLLVHSLCRLWLTC